MFMYFKQILERCVTLTQSVFQPHHSIKFYAKITQFTHINWNGCHFCKWPVALPILSFLKETISYSTFQKPPM